MLHELEKYSTLLETAVVDVIRFVCTVKSLLNWPDTAAEIEDRLVDATSVPSVATAAAIDCTLLTLDIGLIAVTTSYIDELVHPGQTYLETLGYDVVVNDCLGFERDTEMGQLDPSTADNQAKITDTIDTYCVFSSCTDCLITEIIGLLERNLENLVVTSDQPTLENALK